MSIERKKAQPKPIVKTEPKKRGLSEEKLIVAKELIKLEEVVKVKKSENKYERICTEAKAEERTKFYEKVKNDELKYAFYATDGDKGYHHYLVIKK